jgi:t-SNARE complex subunit (syntaxin)
MAEIREQDSFNSSSDPCVVSPDQSQS